MKSSLLVLISSVAIGSIASAAIYSSNFDSLSFGADLAGQDGWTITGASGSGGPSLVTSSPFPYPATSALQGVAFGFQEISGSSTYLQHSYGEPMVGTSLGYTQFLVAMTIQDSAPPYVNRDSFAFTFRDASYQDLFSIKFTPTAQDATPQLNQRVDNVSWSSYVTGDSGVIGVLVENAPGPLPPNPWTTIDLKFELSGLNDVKFTLKSAGVTLDTGVIAGLGSATIDNFGVTWTPFNPSDEGGNQLYFDDMSLIPEPSAALLGLLGATVAFTRRRRA